MSDGYRTTPVRFSGDNRPVKSSRLLSMLLLLQTRQRITVGELASRLEVSTRTVRRDVEALSAAGVPVYTERGRRGGVVLLPGSRVDVTRLDPPEVEALRLAGIDADQRRRLGVHEPFEMATRKMDARRGPIAPDRPPLSDLILVDNSGWFTGDGAGANVADLATDLRSLRRLSLTYRRSGETESAPRIVDPYGLVAKAGRWYLVADRDGTPKLFALSRIESWSLMPEAAVRRRDCTLQSVWTELRAATERAGGVTITARMRTSRLDLAARILGTRMVHVGSGSSGWTDIRLSYSDIQGVRQLLQFGDHIDVLEPLQARELVRSLAEDLVRRHSSTDPVGGVR